MSDIFGGRSKPRSDKSKPYLSLYYEIQKTMALNPYFSSSQIEREARINYLARFPNADESGVSRYITEYLKNGHKGRRKRPLLSNHTPPEPLKLSVGVVPIC